MGEFAQYAVHEAASEEIERVDAWLAGVSDEDGEFPIVDSRIWGSSLDVHDLESSATELSLLEAEFTRLCAYDQRGSPPKLIRLADCASRVQRAVQMRLGMAQQIRQGKQLSVKQRNWVETNWAGGADKFVADLSGPNGDHMIALLDKWSNLFRCVRRLTQDIIFV